MLFLTFVFAFSLYVFFVAPLWFLPVLEWLTPGVLYRVKTLQPLVGLSFDDGPDPQFTLQALRILDQHGAKATFFLIGERAALYPELLDAIRAQGHEIGNHCWKDGSILGLSDEHFTHSLDETGRVLQLSMAGDIPLGGPRQHGEPTLKLFRAPGGVARPRQWRLARERGYLGVLGCAYPHDPDASPALVHALADREEFAPRNHRDSARWHQGSFTNHCRASLYLAVRPAARIPFCDCGRTRPRNEP